MIKMKRVRYRVYNLFFKSICEYIAQKKIGKLHAKIS